MSWTGIDRPEARSDTGFLPDDGDPGEVLTVGDDGRLEWADPMEFDELPSDGEPGDVLVVGPGGQPVWEPPAAGRLKVSTIAELRAFPLDGLAANALIDVLGYWAPGDGGGGSFYYNPASVATDNGGTVIGKWLRLCESPTCVHAAWFGAVAHEAGDDSAEIQAALDIVGLGGTVLLANGTYRTGTTTLNVPNGVSLVGDGLGYGTNGGSKIYYSGLGTAITIGSESRLDCINLLGNSPYPSANTGQIGVKPASGSYRWTMKDCRVIGFSKGLNLNNTYIGLCRNAIITDCAIGVLIEGQEVNATNFFGGDISANGKAVSIIDGPHTGIHFSGVTIEGNFTHGIHVTAGIDGANIFTNLVIEKCYFEANNVADATGYDILLDGPFLRSPIIRDNFMCLAQTCLHINAATGAYVAGNDFRPVGAVPKTITIGAGAVGTFIGPNTFESAAYNPATDNAGTNTFAFTATQVKLPNGSAALPSLGWMGDAIDSMGFFRAFSNGLEYATTGASCLRFPRSTDNPAALTMLPTGALCWSPSGIGSAQDLAIKRASAGVLEIINLAAPATAGGIILRSPDGTRYHIQVANGGALSATPA